MQRHRSKIIIAIVIALYALLIVIYTVPHNGVSSNLTATKFNGTYAPGTDQVLTDYTGQTSTNQDAVQGSYVIFNKDNVQGIPSELTPQLPLMLGNALDRELTPNVSTTYIQIVPNTISCAVEYDCSFSFYTDSPESYFAFHLTYNASGQPLYSIQREALPGAAL